jgi:hypothetical protein
MSTDRAEATLLAYAAIWSEADRSRRCALLAQCMTEDAEVLGPGYRFKGHRAISDEVERFLRVERGARAVFASGYVVHHNAARFAIAMLDPAGKVVSEGEDVVEFAADGRISRVLTFWGALPCVPAAWPRELTLPRPHGA